MKATELKSRGMSTLARKKFAESIDITPDLAYAFIKVLKDWKIEFYIAPYEADAQLAFLYISKRISVVITEDSDLLVYGVTKCFFKMDCQGDGIFLDLENLE
jgi:exonuclease-1